MDLTHSPADEAFRAEARDWLARARARPSRCRRWRPPRASPRTARGRPNWPRPAGRRCPGRGGTAGGTCGLVRWLIFEEEYYRGRRARPGRQNGIFLLAPTLFDHGTEEQQAAGPAADGARRDDLGAGLVGAGGRLRPRRRCAPRATQRRGGWLLNGQKTWSLARGLRPPGLRPVPQRPRTPQRHRGLTYFMFTAGRRRRHRPPDRPARRRAGLRRAVPRRRVRARRRRARRAGPGLAGRDEHGGQRARADAALPRPLLRRGRPAGRALARPARRPPSARTGSPTRGSAPEAYQLLHLRPSPGSPRRTHRRRGESSTRSSGPSSTSPCTRPRSTCSARTGELPRRTWAERLRLRSRRPDLRRHERDPARHHRRAPARPAGRPPRTRT